MRSKLVRRSFCCFSKIEVLVKLKCFRSFSKIKIQFRGILVSDLNGEEITGSFYEKELQKVSQEKFRIEKVLKKRGDELYVKWKGYENRFNSWIDKKSLI